MKRSLELKLSKWGTKTAIKPYLLSLHVLLVNLKLPFLICDVMCRNDTLGWCQCEKDEWRGVQKGVWNAVMSPYETRYVDVRINGEISGSVTVAIEEG